MPWGGARDGAGRPTGSVSENKKDLSLYIRVNQEEKDKIQELAKAANKTVSKYILDLIFGQ